MWWQMIDTFFTWYAAVHQYAMGHVLTVASNHLQGPCHESPKAISKLSNMLIDSHLGQRRYQLQKKILFSQMDIASHSRSGVSQEKYTFNHSTLTLYTLRGFRGRIIHLIMSISLVAIVPMHEFGPALSYISAVQQTKNWNKFWIWVVNVRKIIIFPQINIAHS